jgi:hypothetical protein
LAAADQVPDQVRDQVPDQVRDQETCRARLVQYSPRRATISPVEIVRGIHRDRMARVPEPIVLVDIRLRNRMGNPNDTAVRHTARPTAAAATAVRHIKAVVAIARPATVRQVTADVLTPVAAVAIVLRLMDRHRMVAVVGRVVVRAAAALADRVGQAAPEVIANSRSQISLLLSMPPLTGRLFLYRAGIFRLCAEKGFDS